MVVIVNIRMWLAVVRNLLARSDAAADAPTGKAGNFPVDPCRFV